MPKINFFQILCSLIIGLLRPFSVVLEMFCHEEVGERYPGFASIAALLTLLGWCFFSDDVFPLHVLMLAFVVRLIVHRVMAIRHRLRGGEYVASRSPGRPLVARVIPQLPEQVLVWLEPLALLLVSLVMCIVSSSLGNYLLCGSLAWLAIVIVRTLSAYNRMLDVYDADPQAATPPMLGRLFEVIPPTPAIELTGVGEDSQSIPPLPSHTQVPAQQQ